MPLLKKPNEIIERATNSILVYGQPGSGKTTLGLSAPNPVLIDADNGMKRVEKRFQIISLPLSDYKDVLELFESRELDPFDSIVFDTLGKLVDRMGEYLRRENPKNGNGKGSMSQQGWGAVKVEFQKLLRLAQGKNKNLVFIAHEREERDGDLRIIRPDVQGATGKDIIKDMDLVGYMEMRGDRRTISFTPTEKYYAKNSLKLDPVIEVPDTTIAGNVFIQKFIIGKVIERMKEDAAENDRYLALMSGHDETIAGVSNAETANQALDLIEEAPIIWDSTRVAKHRLAEKIKTINVKYDVSAKEFVDIQQETRVA